MFEGSNGEEPLLVWEVVRGEERLRLLWVEVVAWDWDPVLLLQLVLPEELVVLVVLVLGVWLPGEWRLDWCSLEWDEGVPVAGDWE